MLLIPFLVVGLTFTDSIQSALEWFDKQKGVTLGPPPSWLDNIPIAGTALKDYWQVHAADAGSALNWLKPWLQQAGVWLLQHSLDMAQGIFHLAMSVLVRSFSTETARRSWHLREGFQQISGDYAHELLDVVKGTVQGVVYGTIGTALAQGVLAGIGFAIAGVPSPTQLALFTFFLSFIPVGPPMIWIGASVWLFGEGHTGWGIFMIAYGCWRRSVMVDNVIKPYIISRGSRLSFIIMLIGVLGGLITFGFIGVFLGPTLLAVGYSLVSGRC